MSGLLFDARLCVRALLRTKGMASGAALAIALGVAATITLFSIVHHATRGLPFDDAHELVVLSLVDPRTRSTDFGVRPFDYRQWVEQQRSFEGAHLRVFGRLRDDVTAARARAGLAHVQQRLARASGDFGTGHRDRSTRGQVRRGAAPASGSFKAPPVAASANC